MSAAEKNAGMLDNREVTEALLKDAFSSNSHAPAPDDNAEFRTNGVATGTLEEPGRWTVGKGSAPAAE
ncbi:hypothetical protein IscW_ISCW011525 [Ixodes scapularis]|uniref:Uncharacterized protein n=1 Tax=Ixodes scapularis TaxID=6945 RepID=B7Q6D2_IXOSC|nr:hypothetical protein IscW_ISCW011525 [Ixodes scapularis]|eukprot:XP_002411939.1 hypothetical protein IscW_ISCW011525 [Ixodes scapularis]